MLAHVVGLGVVACVAGGMHVLVSTGAGAGVLPEYTKPVISAVAEHMMPSGVREAFSWDGFEPGALARSSRPIPVTSADFLPKPPF